MLERADIKRVTGKRQTYQCGDTSIENVSTLPVTLHQNGTPSNWYEARTIAKRWLRSHHPESIEARHIDLRGKDGDLIIADPAFRAEIFKAVVRILKARRASSWTLPD